MKLWTLPLAVALAVAVPLAAQAHHPLTAQQRTAMQAQMSHVRTLIAEINHSYSTHFAVAPKSEAMAMAHMARANMEMAKAMMETQVFWSTTPPTLPGGQ